MSWRHASWNNINFITNVGQLEKHKTQVRPRWKKSPLTFWDLVSSFSRGSKCQARQQFGTQHPPRGPSTSANHCASSHFVPACATGRGREYLMKLECDMSSVPPAAEQQHATRTYFFQTYSLHLVVIATIIDNGTCTRVDFFTGASSVQRNITRRKLREAASHETEKRNIARSSQSSLYQTRATGQEMQEESLHTCLPVGSTLAE